MFEPELSIFLSGTRRDVPEFWQAARDALRASHPDFSLSMMEDAEPEDIPGDHWSRRQATKPDVLVGLIGRYYGRVLRGADLSLTEQEFDVAGLVGIDRLMFTTGSCAPELLESAGPEDATRVERFRAKIDDRVVRRGVTTPEEFAEHLVVAIRHWERQTLRGAVQDARTHFAPLLDQNTLFSHTEALVGQMKTLAELKAFCSSGRRIFVLHAPWGRGKSRVLLELARQVETVRFVRDDVPLTRQHLNISAVDPAILVVDDLQRRDDIQLLQLLAFLQRCGPDVKLVLASRSSRVDALAALLRRQGISTSSVLTIELPALSDPEQHDLVAQILGVRNDLTHEVAVRTRGSALAALLAARMIRRGETTFAELAVNPDFVAEVIGHFQDALLLAPELDGATRDRLRAALQLIALCGPVRPGKSAERDAIAHFLVCKPEEVIRDLELLEDRGLLIRRGGLVTIPVDAVRETEALRACVTRRGELTGLAERAIRELAGSFRGNLLRNLARVDFRAEYGGQSVSLLGRVWPELKAAYDEMPASQRMALLGDLKEVAPFQPQESLQFVRSALPSGLGPAETDELYKHFGPLPLEYLQDALAQVLRGALYHPACVAEACDLLWLMARDDPRPAPQHTDSAERALVDFAKLDISRPLECYQAFLGWAEAKLASKEIPGDRLAKYLEPMLEKELDRGYVDDGVWHMWTEGLPVEKLRPLHDRALHLIYSLASQDDVRTAASAIRSIGHALRPPAGAFGRTVTPSELASWQEEQLKALGLLRSVASAGGDHVIELCVLQAVAGVARFSEQEGLRHDAQALTDELVRRLHSSIELALMPHWGPPWDHSELSQQAHIAAVASTAAGIVGASADVKDLIRDIRQAYDRVSAASLTCQAWTLMNELTRLSGLIGSQFVSACLDKDSEVAEHAGGAIAVFLDCDPPLHLDLLDEAVSRGQTHLRRALARGYFFEQWRIAAGKDRFLGHVRELLRSADTVTRLETLRALWFAKEVPVEPRAAILLAYNPALDPPQGDMWAIAINDIYAELSADQRVQLASRLEQLPSLGHFDDRLLEKLCADEPGAAVDMLLARVQRADDHAGYEAVSRRGVGDGDPLAPIPAGERERALSALGHLLNHESFRVRHAAQELFARLGDGSPAIRSRVRRAWAQSGGAGMILAAAQSYRREGWSVLFEEEDVIIRILEAAKHIGGDTHRQARSELLAASSVEIRLGSPSDSEYLDAKIRDRARAVAAKQSPGSPGHLFYLDLAAHAQSMIDVLVEREQEHGLEP